MANINGKVCCKEASFSLADSYDSLPPELRNILRDAPYDLQFPPPMVQCSPYTPEGIPGPLLP